MAHEDGTRAKNEEIRNADLPYVSLQSLDELWFQVGGTLCNLSCTHCFISCHPSNHAFGFLGLETVKKFLEEARRQGVKEFYFTGGEPFLNREMLPILAETLRHGPATVLTNGTIFQQHMVAKLRAIALESRYSLEIRVSIDGYDSATNDPIRGAGTFEKAMQGVLMLVKAGFLPIITMTQTWPEEETPEVFRRFVRVLNERGYSRPRIKILPTLHLGMEESRSRPYLNAERVTAEMLKDYDTSQLVCSHSRMVTDRGVAVCPILIEAADANMGSTLEEAGRPFAISHGACYTCYLHGAICSNAAASIQASDR